MTDKQKFAQKIAADFHEFLAEFHRYPQPYDDQLDADIYERYAKVLREQSKWGYFNYNENPEGIKRPHFSPSSAGTTDRELYEKAGKKKRDKTYPTENQRDWTGLGSVVGDYIQREVLLAERHFEKFTGKKPRFRMKRLPNGNPAYEHFCKKMHEIEHNGQHFAYFGLPDGILEYLTDEGEWIDVGLEIKSSQKSWSDFKRLDEPKPKHAAQTTAYSDMYNFEYVIVFYFLTYGRGWDEDFSRKKPFGLYISEEDRMDLRDRCAEAVYRAKTNNPPEFEPESYRYSDFKTAIATGLSDEEMTKLERQATAAQSSRLPEWKKRQYTETYEDIVRIRKDHGINEEGAV